MLQIATGRFFDEDFYENPGVAVLYTNKMLMNPIETPAGTLTPTPGVNTAGSTLVFSYRNRLGKGDRPGVVRVGDSELVEQMRLFIVFAFRSYTALRLSHLEHMNRATHRGESSEPLPRDLAPGFFEPRDLRPDDRDVARLINLVATAMKLPRERYTAVVAYLDGFVSALEASDYNADLAYSMLVYCLESLAQQFANAAPAWADYPDDQRRAVDAVLAHIDAARANELRGVLLDAAHVKLSQTFQQFVVDHLRDEFFEERPAGRGRAVRPSELRRALRNAYQVRSAFVHRLAPVREQLHLRHVAANDLFNFDNEPFPTFSGLLRIATEVLETFVQRSPQLEREQFEWRRQLPGILEFKKAPQMWISGARPLELDEKAEAAWFSAFLAHVDACIFARTDAVSLKDALAPFATHNGNVAARKARRLFVAGEIYCRLWSTDDHPPLWDEARTRYLASVAAERTIEAAVLALFHNEVPIADWTFEDWSRVLEAYQRHQFGKLSIALPVRFELVLRLHAARAAFNEGRVDAANRELLAASREAINFPAIARRLRNAAATGTLDVNMLWPAPPDEETLQKVRSRAFEIYERGTDAVTVQGGREVRSFRGLARERIY